MGEIWADLRENSCLWAKKGDWDVRLGLLGKIGKKKAFENDWKRLKNCEKLRKMMWKNTKKYEKLALFEHKNIATKAPRH